MIEACKTGQPAQLQRLFEDHHVSKATKLFGIGIPKERVLLRQLYSLKQPFRMGNCRPSDSCALYILPSTSETPCP
jgi:hypothetical protein